MIANDVLRQSLIRLDSAQQALHARSPASDYALVAIGELLAAIVLQGKAKTRRCVLKVKEDIVTVSH